MIEEYNEASYFSLTIGLSAAAEEKLKPRRM